MKLHQWIKVCRKIICGIKRIVSFLTEDLVQRGHDVTMFASGASLTFGLLVVVIPWRCKYYRLKVFFVICCGSAD